ncbi:MAG TPA: undecaprenyl-diphosphatase UppP [Solirubrobacterales bacterium]|nr:undecaprenyl-diphosphatase UppP [Solirubrobacterales bacterium]
MSELEALLLGIVQGLTEFLPISSSGHLILVPWAQQYHFLEHHESFNKTFDVALHAGTLVAVLGYFRAEIVRLLRGLWRSLRVRTIEGPDQRLAWAIVVATIPAVIAGGLGESFIEDHLGEPWQIAILLIFFGLLLGYADRRPEREHLEGVGMRQGLYVGLAQVLALAPGVSRSGITITAGRFLGLDRDSAARFSFLLLAPVTAGAVVFKGYKAVSEGLPDGVVGPMIVGTIAAAVSGYLAIAGLLALVRRHNYDVFVVYRVLIGITVLLLIATGVLNATF